MKNFTILIIILSFLSCKKDGDNDLPGRDNNPLAKKYCWSCRVSVTISANAPGFPQTGTSSTSFCDATESEMRAHVQKAESDGTKSETRHGITVRTKTNVSCSKSN